MNVLVSNETLEPPFSNVCIVIHSLKGVLFQNWQNCLVVFWQENNWITIGRIVWCLVACESHPNENEPQLVNTSKDFMIDNKFINLILDSIKYFKAWWTNIISHFCVCLKFFPGYQSSSRAYNGNDCNLKQKFNIKLYHLESSSAW